MNNARPRRRFLRYSLRGLLLGIVVVAIGLAFLTGDIRRALRQASDMKTLREHGGYLTFHDATEHQRFLLRFLPRDGVLAPRRFRSVGTAVDQETFDILGRYTSWESLALRTDGVKDGPLREAISRWTRLGALYLHGNFRAGAIPDLSNHSELRTLSLSSNCDSTVIPAIASAPQLGTLELDSNIGNDYLTELFSMSTLKYLILRGNSAITDRAVQGDASESLLSFDVGKTQFGDAGFQAVLKWRNLLYLGAYNTQITDAAFEKLDQADAGATRLRDLDLSGTKITSTALVGISKIKTLDTLSLGRTAVDDRNLELLNDLPDLKLLVLDSPITDAGLAKLDLPRLESLFINGTEITADGLAELLSRLPAVELVRVRGCPNISQADIQALKQQFPDLAPAL